MEDITFNTQLAFKNLIAIICKRALAFLQVEKIKNTTNTSWFGFTVLFSLSVKKNYPAHI